MHQMFTAHFTGNIADFSDCLAHMDPSLETSLFECCLASTRDLYLALDDKSTLEIVTELPRNSHRLLSIEGNISLGNRYAVPADQLGCLILVELYKSARYVPHQL
jgi:hypothetical protein